MNEHSCKSWACSIGWCVATFVLLFALLFHWVAKPDVEAQICFGPPSEIQDVGDLFVGLGSKRSYVIQRVNGFSPEYSLAVAMRFELEEFRALISKHGNPYVAYYSKAGGVGRSVVVDRLEYAHVPYEEPNLDPSLVVSIKDAESRGYYLMYLGHQIFKNEERSNMMIYYFPLDNDSGQILALKN